MQIPFLVLRSDLLSFLEHLLSVQFLEERSTQQLPLDQLSFTPLSLELLVNTCGFTG